MSVLLSGKVARLLARLGTPASSTIAAKLDTLHDTRITAARAANLDKLDATVSGIASGGKHRAVQILTGSGSWTHPANVKDNLVYVTLVGGGGGGGRLSGAGNGGSGGRGAGITLRMPVILVGGSTAYGVGTGGAGRGTDGVGNAGNATTFGPISAPGGVAGQDSSSNPGTGNNGALDGLLTRFGAEGGFGANDGGGDGKAGGSMRGAGGAADAGSGGGGASWGNGGNAVAAGGSGANAPANSGGGGGGCNTGTSGAGGSGYILIEYEEASASGGGGSGVTVDDLKKYPGQNLQTGTTYDLALTDAGLPVEMTNAAANTVRIRLNSVVPMPLNTRIDIYQGGAGLTSVIAEAGVTTRGDLNSAGQNKALSLWQRAIDDWYVVGGVA